ncbi:MAG: NAD-dependent epimerase/dehydratase family protein [Bacteroidetes bacterium]|nr:NAD-dependent epimerase/dehydratase family protein [Bacteroidota bacterium]
MRILVTGGAGFIGSHITDALVNRGHDVHVIDDLSGGRREQVNPKATFHQLDIRDKSIGELWKTHQFEVMYHLAAQMDVRKSVADPGYDADINIGGLLNLMESGRKNGLKKVVFSSTGGAIYGEPERVPQDESHTLQPLSPYGITKLCSEKYLHFYKESYGVEYVALRYGNVYGPRQNPHGEAGVVAIFCERMLDSKQPTIFGDGLQTRDYVFVTDVVAANLQALEFSGSDIFNVGTGVETNVVELFRTLRDAIAPTMAELYAAGKPGEQKRSVLDYTKSKLVLGWTPQVEVTQGLRLVAEWFQERRDT